MITYVVPSRGRPHNVTELLDAWDTTRGGAAELVIAVDDDDPTLDAYRAIELPLWATMHVGPRLRLGGTLNALAPALAGSGDYFGVGFMGDDHRPRSLSWDLRIDDHLGEHPGAVVYGNDLVQGENLPTAVVLDSLIVNELGYYVPPGAVHLFLDNYWLELGRRLGTLAYLRDVVIEHVHPITGKVAWDAGYAEVNADEVWNADKATFGRYVELELDTAVARITRRLSEGGPA